MGGRESGGEVEGRVAREVEAAGERERKERGWWRKVGGGRVGRGFGDVEKRERRERRGWRERGERERGERGEREI